MAPAQLVVFFEEEAGECMTSSPSEEEIGVRRACRVFTCGERSKHFIEDMMNLAFLFT